MKYSDEIQEAKTTKNSVGVASLQAERNMEIQKVMEDAFEETEKKLFTMKNDVCTIAELSGATGTILVVLEDYFVVANCGDSPVFVFRQGKPGKITAEQISLDHKPEMEEEAKRIIATGGILDQHESALTGKKLGPLRVWSNKVRQPGLAMTRSLGDGLAKTCGVICKPTVRVVQRDKAVDRAVLVCSDGISDQVGVEEMEEIVQFFYKSQDTESCCKQFVEMATERWHKRHNMQDDITSIILFFR
jgi:serine/threonine protein phosphatase PrpC